MRRLFARIAAASMTVSVIVSAVPAAMAAQAAEIYPGDGYVRTSPQLYRTFDGSTGCVNCAKETYSNNIWLVDKENNVRVIGDGSYSVSGEGNGRVEQFRTPTNIEPVAADAADWDTKAEMLANVVKVRNYYRNTLNHTDFDFSGSGDQGFYAFEFNNSCDARARISTDNFGKCQDYTANLLGFGEGDQENYFSMGVDVGAVGHEFTHLFVNKELGWWPDKMNTETEALMEAYCDIIGELCEDEPDWMVGADVFRANTYGEKKYSLRDMRNPQGTRNPKFGDIYIDYFDDYSNYKRKLEWLKSNNPYPMHPCYLGTTVIDHAAYLMYEAGISKDDLAKIWYRSVYYYRGDTTKATFVDCRDAVEKAAYYSFGSSSRELQIVKKAFDDVRVKSHRTSLSQATAAVPTRMSDFTRIESYNLPEGRYWNTGDPNTASRVAKYGDTSTYLPMGPTAIKNFVICSWQNEEPYYQCAGFAKKLQTDFFHTDTFVQNSDLSYVPELGDHLRVDQYSRSTYLGTHSVFIRAIDSNTITYADCNSDQNNVIKWNNRVSWYRENDGRFCFSDGLCTYKFVWVERPLKQGDTNADGVLDNNDLVAMDNIISGNISYRMYDGLLREFTADINGDYVVDSADRDILYDLINCRNYARERYGFVIY